jgi:hypothetical protein
VEDKGEKHNNGPKSCKSVGGEFLPLGVSGVGAIDEASYILPPDDFSVGLLGGLEAQQAELEVALKEHCLNVL